MRKPGEARRVIRDLERANHAWSVYAEGLRRALMDERSNHARTLRHLEECEHAFLEIPEHP